MKLKNKIVALFLTVACAFGLAVAGNAQKVDAAEEKLTISFADKAQRTVFTTSQQVWEQNGIVVTNDKGSSTSNVADYANPARFYKNSKLTVATELNIAKIEFTCNSSSYATALKSSITGVTPTVSGSVVTVTLAGDANNFVIAKLSGGQVRVNSLAVYVIPAVSEDMSAEDRVAGAVEELSISNTVINALTLPVNGANETTITWASSDEDTLDANGAVVLRDVEDSTVTLTATISYEDVSETKEFEVTVLGENTIVDNALASLKVAATTVASITLPTNAAEVASIAWASDDEEILTKAGKLVARPAEDTIVTLTATATVGSVSKSKEFEVTVKAGRDIVKQPEANKYYKMVVTQGNLNKDLYLTGAMNGYYYATTEDVSKAALVSLVEVEGGYHLVSTVNGVSKYMNVKASGTYINAYLEATAVSVWTFNTTYNTFTTKVGSETYYLGCYNSYNTYSPSKLSYLSGSSNFAANLVELTAEEAVKAMGVKVGFQVGTKDEAKALRLVAEFGFTAEEVANFDKEISFRVTRNGVADERVVTTLYSSVNPMNDEEVLEDGYYAVLTYVNVPAGEYLVEVLVDGVVAATVTATVA